MTRLNRSRTATLALLCFLIVLSASAFAEEWLQWGGPRGDFTTNSGPLAETWPASGPKQIWKRTLGDGYSAILCKRDQLFTEYSDAKGASVVCLDAGTGHTKWEHRYEFTLWPDMEKSFGLGPNATPAIMGGRLLSISIDGVVRCLDQESGSPLWQHDLPKEFGRRKRVEEYGYSSSPLVYKNSIIVQVGGDHHAVVAFEPDKGATVWKSEPGGVSYAPATLTTLAGQEQYVYFEPEGVAALDPATGKTLWRAPIEFNNGNHLTPIVKCDDEHIWVGSQFLSGGGRLLNISRKDGVFVAVEKWFTSKLRTSHWTMIRLDDVIYGSIGGNDVSFLAGFDWKTGKLLWRERGFHKAQSLYADGKLLFLDEAGQLGLARLSPDGITILASAKLTEPVSWTLPTLVGTKLYLRDRKNIMALKLGQSNK